MVFSQSQAEEALPVPANLSQGATIINPPAAGAANPAPTTAQGVAAAPAAAAATPVATAATTTATPTAPAAA